MYLIRVELDRNAYEVRSALMDCEKMHILVTGLFGTQRSDSSVLYRLNAQQNRLQLYLYASVPVTEEACRKYPVVQRDITQWVSGLEQGQIRQFDLTASPSKKVPSETGKNSQRRILRQPEQRMEWLQRKAEQYGFTLLQVQELEQLHLSGSHRKESGGKMYLDAWHYQGMLRIDDAQLFRKALEGGIGSGKAYGFGMLMLK